MLWVGVGMADDVSGMADSVPVSGMADGVSESGMADGVSESGMADGVSVSGMADDVSVSDMADGVPVTGMADGVSVSGMADGVPVGQKADGVSDRLADGPRYASFKQHLHCNLDTECQHGRTARIIQMKTFVNAALHRRLHPFEVCPETHFRCPGESDYCMPVFVRCNGVYDCTGHEDEARVWRLCVTGLSLLMIILTCGTADQLLKGRDYSFGVMVVLNFVLFLLISVGQAFIYWSVRLNSMATETTRKSQDLTIARRLITVAVSDFLCWFPVGLLGLMAAAGIPVASEFSVFTAVIVLPLNSALNPFLYTYNVLAEKRRKAREARLLELLQSQVTSEELE
nr:hypothetical protein BaRGS_002712 [Batillaria attramentaria]